MRFETVANITAAVALATTLLGVAHGAPGKADGPFQVVERYTLGGSDRWDYLGFDEKRHHLFISRASHVQVFDTDAGKVIGDIPGTDGVHGFAFVQPRKLGFATNGRADTITVFDLDTLKVVDTIKAGGADPDAILYVPRLNRLFTSNGHAASVSAIDPATRKVVATMPVGGKPESLAAGKDGRVFVNIEDKGEIVALDGKSNRVLAHWPLASCDEPSGLAIDTRTQRLFTVCANQRMLVVDARNGRTVAQVPIGGHPDAAAFDPASRTIFSANGGDGTLTLIHEDAPDRYSVRENLPTETGARTLALDETAHRVFLVSSKFTATAPTADQPHPRPSVVPGTFSVLVAAAPKS